MPSSSLLSVLCWVQAWLVILNAEGVFWKVSSPQQCYLQPEAKDHGRGGGNVTVAGVKGKKTQDEFLIVFCVKTVIHEHFG